MGHLMRLLNVKREIRLLSTPWAKGLMERGGWIRRKSLGNVPPELYTKSTSPCYHNSPDTAARVMFVCPGMGKECSCVCIPFVISHKQKILLFHKSG
jgi:hypothetical protein